jgi:hypothetical protein
LWKKKLSNLLLLVVWYCSFSFILLHSPTTHTHPSLPTTTPSHSHKANKREQAGGDKYIVRNILFKFAVDSQGLYAGDYGAAKVGGHELKGVIAYFNALSDQVLCLFGGLLCDICVIV